MKTCATALANYFVDLANNSNVELMQFGLMKRVYIAHGFCLAVFDKPALNPRFDVVEAWKNGPVIPSVYHSFKYNGDKPIKEKSVIAEWKDGKIVVTTPKLEDKDVVDIANAVWKRYEGYSDFDLIELLHKKGTPWDLCYVEGENRIIPDIYTKVFYSKVLDYAAERKNFIN